MAHPIRADNVEKILSEIDRPIPVAWDGGGPPSADKQRRWFNGRKAWEMATGEWHLVLQDDAIVVPDLLTGLERMLEYVPDDIGLISPYFGTRRPSAGTVNLIADRARQENPAPSFIRLRALNWGVSIMARTADIEAMANWCDTQYSMAYDTRVGQWFLRNRRDTLYPWPSLVDHLEGPSLVGHGSTGRHAHNLATGSALDVDWSGPTMVDPRVAGPQGRPRMDRIQSRRVVQLRHPEQVVPDRPSRMPQIVRSVPEDA